MKSRLLVWLIIFALLSGCAVTPTNPPSQVAPTPSPTSPSTSTPKPTLTPTLSPTSTATPRPQPTATFNAALAIKRTPEPPAQCPKENPSLVPTFAITSDPQRIDFSLEKPILDFLNSGGSRRTIIAYLKQLPDEYLQRIFDGDLFEKDLTNDGVPELVVSENHFRIYACKNGRYYTAADIGPYPFSIPSPIAIQDANLDGIPEIILKRTDFVSVGKEQYFQILEWDGQKFTNEVFPPNDNNWNAPIADGWIVSWGWFGVFDNYPKPFELRDIDNNGTLELILTGGVPHGSLNRSMGEPWRGKTRVYMWNGKNFVLSRLTFAPPHFRFQAIRDGDRNSLEMNHEESLKFYLQTILDDKLESWSESRRVYEGNLNYILSMGTPAPPLPVPDPTERDNLTAYAYYRIMLLNVIQRQSAEAQTTYKVLQEKFPNGHTGYYYAEMATAFWDEYQKSKDIESSCNKAIEYTRNHQVQILYYLTGHHGGDDPKYKPEDICPFK